MNVGDIYKGRKLTQLDIDLMKQKEKSAVAQPTVKAKVEVKPKPMVKPQEKKQDKIANALREAEERKNRFSGGLAGMLGL